MKKLLLFTLLIVLYFVSYSQIGTEFWFAPPEVTYAHNIPGGRPIYLMLSSANDPADVTVEIPANPGFTPMVINLAANSSQRIDLSNFINYLETEPTNTVLNTGLHIYSTDTISAYYEVSNTNNCDIFALKGENALGYEFYIPLHNNPNFYNHDFAPDSIAYASFDIVATEDNTEIIIYTKTDVDGHTAYTPFYITLNRGQTYSCGWTGANYRDPSTHPSGAVVVADKPIAITIKDDSCHNPSGGCYDLMGDQIVPIDVVGNEYIAVEGSLNATGDESVFILATENNTKVYIDGSSTPHTTLFAGQTYMYNIEGTNTTYIQTDKNVYVTHVTGFGCEEGVALLPPLNCAGSRQISFVRSSSEAFYLTIFVKAGAEDGFLVDGDPTLIQASDFSYVNGTGNTWMYTRKQFNTTDIPVNVAKLIVNTKDKFSMGIINGGATTGCRYGFFSEYVAKIYADAGPDQTICENSTATLSGNIWGGANSGTWTTSGDGTFDDPTSFNAVYTPGFNDLLTGSVTLTITSNSICYPQSDDMTITFTPAPTADAGPDQTVCANNPNVNLSGSVTVATGGVWSGGSGTFSPNNTTLSAVYTPTPAEIASGSVTLTLTTTGNGTCNAVSDNMTITFTPAPIVNAGGDQSVCANNPDVTLNGSVTVATGGVWTGGSGSFNPSNTALGAIYTPSAGEIAAGSVTLTLTSTGNGNCIAESDQMTITITPAPVVNAGPDQTVCANNPDVPLNGSVTGATGGQWSGGLGIFTPSNTNLNAIYTPTAGEIAAGSVTLTLTSTGNGNCNAVTDQMTITITPAPTVDAGADQTVCANNPDVTLNGSVTIASGGTWTGGTGTFSPNNNTLNATYTPSAAEISAGTVTLTLTSTGNGNCSPVSDQMTITITPAPTANAGPDQLSCVNSPSVNLAGSVTVATGGIWSGGGGTFNPNTTDLSAVYTPSAAEIASGSATLTLTTTGNGNCLAVSDQMNITIGPAPVVDAGSDQTLCANNADIYLNGSVSGATGGQWSGGLGIFTPDNNTLNAVYSPTTTEISNGSITLTLTSTGNGNCVPESDAMTTTFTVAPTADAGPDQTVCANNPDVTLNGSVTVATGGIWSGGSGTFNPNNTTLNAVYTPSSAEIAAGTVILTLTTTGNGLCNPVSDQMTITITPAPTANAGIDLNSCVNNPDVTLNGSITVATGGIWSGGSGTFAPNNTTLNAVYTPSAAEIAAGTATLTLTTTGNGNCLAVSDQVDITIDPSPVVDAGPDQTKCANNANITLSGSVTGATGGQWTGGLGIFNPSNTALNAIYTPTSAEIASGSLTLTLTSTGNGNCNAVSDNITITFTSAPVVNAGSDQVTCENNPDALLNGSISGASGGVWSGGFGTFNPDNTTLNAIYTPSATEIAVGSVTLTLTTTGNGNCLAETDDVTIVINDAPIVNAGPDLNSCENNPTVTLNGNVLYATGGQWLGGTGTFNPSNTVLNPTYTPSSAEIAAGSVTLTLESTGNGNCLPVTDDIVINIGPAPIVDAGSDQTVCGNNPDVVLNGTVTGAAGGQWSGGLGVFTPNNSILNATYTPTAGEIAAGSVTLTLTSTGNGNCNAEQDQMTIYYTTSPSVDAGVDQSVCANNPDVTLNGSINSVPTGAIWSGGLGTFTPDNTTLNAVYTPTASEIAAGGVTLTLTTTGNGNCNAESDDVDINITSAPTVVAGPDQTICVDNLTVNLNGFVGGPTTTGQWSSTGTGTFVPNNTSLNASYICSTNDSINGGCQLILTSTSNGNCLPVSDTLDITILPAGFADAGNDTSLCANNAILTLNGLVYGGATTGVWSSSGTGVFVPTNTNLNATYIPSAYDTSIGSVILTLTANSCNAASDQITVTYTPAPYIDAGPDQIVCVDNLDVQLDGHAWGATNTAVWSTSGTGTFSPNNTTLDAIYYASAADSAAGNVTLVLTATNYGTCNIVRDTMEISILPAGVVDAGSDQILCSNNANVQLNGTVSGGATEGIWSTSGSGYFIPSDTSLNATYVPSASDTATGMVTLALTATNSCNFAMDIITINFTPAPTANAGPDQTVCANNPDVILTGSVTIASGGLWSTSGTGTFSPSSTSLNATYSPSTADINNGNVDIYLTTTGNGGCSPVTDTMSVTITPEPFVYAGPNQTVCSTSDSTQLQGIVSGVTTQGIWTTSGTGTFSPNDSTLDAYYIYSSADTALGSVTLTLTSTNNGNCYAVNDDVTITFGATAYANAGNDVITCASDLSVPLNGFISGGATQGIWSTSGTGTFTPDNTTLNATYLCSNADSLNGSVDLILTTTNNGGCQPGVDTMNIQIEYLPVADAGPDMEVCLGADYVNLNGSLTNASSCVWTTTGSGYFVPNDSTAITTYYFTAADSINGAVTFYLTTDGSQVCNENSDTTSVIMTIPLVPGFNYSTPCMNNTIHFTDNTQINSGTITNWEWNFGSGNIIYAEDTTFTYSTTGYQTIIYTVSSSLGCDYSITDSIYVYPLPIVDFNYSTECYKDSIHFTDNSSVQGGTITNWLWNFGDGHNSFAQNPANLYNAAGDYNVELTVTSDQGCSNTDSITVTVNPLPVADFDYSFDCKNFIVSFYDSSTSVGNPLNFWNWNFGDGNTDNLQNPQNTYSSTGNYLVELITGSTPNCTDTISKNITIYTIHADFDFENQCKYDTIYFVDQSTSDGGIIDSWLWYFGDGNTSDSQNPGHLYLNNGQYNVSLVIQSEEGCVDSVAYFAEAYVVPDADFSYDAEEFLVNYLITFTNNSNGATSYIWNFGDSIGTSTVVNPTYTYLTEGSYNVFLIAKNDFGCIDTAIQNIIITGVEDVYAPVLPTAFTPNNDGENDTLYVRGGPFKELVFCVYNEWGEKIFESNDANIGWDGKKNGVDQPIGVYVYTVKAVTLNDKKYNISGDITLIR